MDGCTCTMICLWRTYVQRTYALDMFAPFQFNSTVYSVEWFNPFNLFNALTIHSINVFTNFRFVVAIVVVAVGVFENV